MEIRIDPHTLERAEERGTTAEEIREVIIRDLRCRGNMVGWVGGKFIRISKRGMVDIMNKSELRVST